MPTIKAKNKEGLWVSIPLIGSGENVNLDGYASKEWVNQLNFLKEVPTEYVTESELNLKGYITDISGKLDKSTYNIDKPKFALKTELPKDYLTAKDLANKADKSELDNKADKVKRVNNDVTTLEIKPNTLYVWDEVTSLNITLANPTDSTIANEYMFQFTSGTQPTTLSLPQDIKWIGDNKIEASKTYQVSILNNIAIMGGV